MSRPDPWGPIRPRMLKALTLLAGCRPGAPKRSVQVIADALGLGDPVQIAMRGVVYRTVSEHPDLVALNEHLNKWYVKDDDGEG